QLYHIQQPITDFRHTLHQTKFGNYFKYALIQIAFVQTIPGTYHRRLYHNTRADRYDYSDLQHQPDYDSTQKAGICYLIR
ncbi:hypothetical protein, partial [Lentibacillus sp.]|uniref:hypothetical protein n=1 Tax=Lentibacillus sp. TaxID=1925746 RepID=UPI002B4B4C2C